MTVLKNDGTTKKFDTNKIPKLLEWMNDPKSESPNISGNISDEDISEKFLIEYIQSEKIQKKTLII